MGNDLADMLRGTARALVVLHALRYHPVDAVADAAACVVAILESDDNDGIAARAFEYAMRGSGKDRAHAQAVQWFMERKTPANWDKRVNPSKLQGLVDALKPVVRDLL